MLTEERYAKIISILDSNGSATVQQLMTALDASESTIRRDLNALDEMGRVIKVHGGALSKRTDFSSQDAHANERKEQNKEDKIRIAKYAAGLVENDDFIYLDAGTTTELMVDYLSVQKVTFVTNGISLMKRLAERGFTTYILGGEYKPVTDAIVGEEAVLSLEKYNFTKGFWGTNSIDVQRGFATPELREALVKKKAMSHCKQRYVLADDSKFSQMSSVVFANFTDATVITTNLTQTMFRKYKNVMEV